MTKATETKIEMVKAEFGGNWFTAKAVKNLLNSDFIRTLVKNVPEIVIDKQTVEIEISGTEYAEFMEKYGDRMDTVNFGGVGMCYTENGKYYNKCTETRYRFPE